MADFEDSKGAAGPAPTANGDAGMHTGAAAVGATAGSSAAAGGRAASSSFDLHFPDASITHPPQQTAQSTAAPGLDSVAASAAAGGAGGPPAGGAIEPARSAVSSASSTGAPTLAIPAGAAGAADATNSAAAAAMSGTPIAVGPEGVRPQSVPSMFYAASEETEDGRKYNPQVMSFIRDEWISKQLVKREGEFTEYTPLRAFVGTWNVNGKAPEESIDTWLGDLRTEGSKLPDFFIVGFQEIVDLNAANVVVGAATEKRAAQWEAHIVATLDRLATAEKFVVIQRQALVGIFLVVLVKQQHVKFISQAQGTCAGVGVLGVMGNKGAAAIRFQYRDSTMCFVCSHLAASRSHVAQRNSDFLSILQKVEFVDAARDASARAADASAVDSVFGILEHDYVIWLGDLNYRIVEGVSTNEVNRRCDACDLEFLRDRDQLNIERASGRVFQHFNEGTLTFLPTYKYQAGTDQYERRPDKKIRAPAWCDRVLWRCNTNNPSHIQQLYYGRTEQIMSDHKPVHSLFEVSVKIVDNDRRTAVYREIMRTLDKIENQSIPKVELSANTIHFEKAAYKELSQQSITLYNRSDVVAQYRFVPKLEDKSVFKSWLTAEPMYGMLLPGEQADIRFSCYVDEVTCRNVVFGRDRLQDILILRLENGGDFFITATATLMPTAFCSTVEDLVCSTEPRRSCPIALKCMALASGAMSSLEQEPVEAVLRVPKELWRLIDFLYTRGMDTPGIFVNEGIANETFAIRRAIDTGDTLSATVSAVSVAAVLLELLSTMEDTVIPCNMFPGTELEHVTVDTWVQSMLEQLPAPNFNTLIYLMAFLRQCLTHTANELDVATLGRVFGRCLLRPQVQDQFTAVVGGASAMLTSLPLADAPADPRTPAQDAAAANVVMFLLKPTV